MEYDISSGTWTTLPPNRISEFTLTVISNQLVLVGGYEHPNMSNVLGVWRGDRQAWTHPYPTMPTARCCCSAVVYNQWLVVAGGYGSDNHCLSCVEILNTDSNQWHTRPQMPRPWGNMKTAVVGNIGYFMGNNTTSGYSVYLPALIFQLPVEIWKEIPGLQLTRSAPLSISGSLFAFGGVHESNAVTAIHLYQPNTGDWVKVGDLPSPRYQCTCVMIADREILVAGGQDEYNLTKTTVDIALVANNEVITGHAADDVI